MSRARGDATLPTYSDATASDDFGAANGEREAEEGRAPIAANGTAGSAEGTIASADEETREGMMDDNGVEETREAVVEAALANEEMEEDVTMAENGAETSTKVVDVEAGDLVANPLHRLSVSSADKLECVICLETVDSLEKFPNPACQHEYCAGCLAQITQQAPVACPLCRRPAMFTSHWPMVGTIVFDPEPEPEPTWPVLRAAIVHDGPCVNASEAVGEVRPGDSVPVLEEIDCDGSRMIRIGDGRWVPRVTKAGVIVVNAPGSRMSLPRRRYMRCTFISLLVTLAVMAVSASLDPGSLTLERSGIVVHRSNQLRQMTWMFNVLLLLFILIMVREGCSELGRLPRPAAPRTRQERNDQRERAARAAAAASQPRRSTRTRPAAANHRQERGNALHTLGMLGGLDL